MLNKRQFGQYIPRASRLHRLDARVKLIVLILFIATLLMLRSSLGLLLMALLVFFHLRGAKLTGKEAWASLRPLLPILVFAFLLNLFVLTPGENPCFSFYFLKISQESISRALNMALRVGSLIFISNLLLTLTTSAMEICDALAFLLAPLRKIGVPVQDIAMMMSIALRFVPTLIEETDKIMKAQASRGADYDTGGLMKRVRGFVTVLVPLFISAFRRAEALASAMEARAYRSDLRRGKLHPLKMRRFDYFYLSGMAVLLFSLVLGDRLGVFLP